MSKQGTAVILGLLIGAITLAFANLFSNDHVPAYRDLLVFVVPFKHFLAENLRAGHVPLWNPYIYMGTPFLASLQSGVLYPPSVLLLVPFPLGFNLFLLAHFLVALAGFWVLLRDRRLSVAAAATGSLTFVLGGYMVSMLNLTNNLQACAWAPWAFLLWVRSLNDPTPRKLALLTGALCLELLGGAPEVLILTVVLVVAWTLYKRWRQPQALGRAVARLTAVLLVVAALTAFQIVPTLEYIQQSDRSQALSYDEVTTWSLEPVSLIQLILPHSASLDTVPGVSRGALAFEHMTPWIDSIYLGLVPLVLLVAGVVAGSERAFWGATALTALVLALGRHTPLFAALYHSLPWLVGKFRYPEKFFFLVHFAASVLAAEGLEAVQRRETRALRAAVAAAATFLAISAAFVSIRWLAPSLYLQGVAVLTGTFASFPSFVPLALNVYLKAMRAVLLVGCFLAVLLFRRMSVLRSETAAVLLVALTAADLTSIQYDLNTSISWSAVVSGRPILDLDSLRRDHARLFLYQTISDPLPGNLPQPIRGLEHWSTVRGRSLDFADFARTLWRVSLLDIPMIQDVETLSGADGISRDSDNTMRNALSVVPRDKAVKLLRVFGVTRLMGQVELDDAALESVDSALDRPYFIYRVKEPVPVAYLASHLFATPTRIDAFNRMISPEFRAGFDATVEKLPDDWKDRGTTISPGTVSVARWSAERIDLEVKATRPALLVLNASFYPGWEASLDGRTVTILRTNALVRGVMVPPGAHRVGFRYRPRSLRIGSAISLTALIAALGYGLSRVRDRRRHGAPLDGVPPC